MFPSNNSSDQGSGREGNIRQLLQDPVGQYQRGDPVFPPADRTVNNTAELGFFYSQSYPVEYLIITEGYVYSENTCVCLIPFFLKHHPPPLL